MSKRVKMAMIIIGIVTFLGIIGKLLHEGLTNDSLPRISRLDQFMQMAKDRCTIKALSNKVNYEHDYTDHENGKLSWKKYNQGKILPFRVYYSKEKGKFMMPLTEYGEAFSIPDNFFKALITHIESIIIADAKDDRLDDIFLPNVAHIPFYIPKRTYTYLVSRVSRDVYIHANKSGCFPYAHRGTIKYFDIGSFSSILGPLDKNEDESSARQVLFFY